MPFEEGHPDPGRVPGAGGTKPLGIELKRLPSDSAFRYFFLQVDVAAVCAAIRDWTIAQIPGEAAEIDQ